jgi:hypothetical protein
MSPFDLLFILVVLASLATLAVVTAAVLAGRFRKAALVCAGYLGGLVLYLGVVVGVALASPQRTLALGEDQRFDDWCIAVDDVVRSGSPGQENYTVTVRLSNRARRVSQREKGVVVYLIDDKGRRFDAAPDPCAVPLDVRLEPGQSVTTPRTFEVSGASGRLALVVGRDGLSRFPGLFIISDDSSLLHKPRILPLAHSNR